MSILPSKNNIQIYPIHGLPEINSGDNIGNLIIKSLFKNKLSLLNNDILIITQKIISKSEDRLVHKNSIIPSNRAIKLSKKIHKSPKLTELILNESVRIVKRNSNTIVTETKHGFICANSGIDQSNIKKDYFCLLPLDSDLSALRIRKIIKKQLNVDVAVIVSDTFGRPFRLGQTDVAIGVSGIEPLLNYHGKRDKFGKEIKVTNIAIADELTSAAELVFGKLNRVPVALIRGYPFKKKSKSIKTIIMPKNRSLFS
jgi:coenzyme F420-0:L-glutamate ligase/coenzyme F420-1:gamma-L-glutamate ligase